MPQRDRALQAKSFVRAEDAFYCMMTALEPAASLAGLCLVGCIEAISAQLTEGILVERAGFVEVTGPVQSPSTARWAPWGASSGATAFLVSSLFF
jgi:hypothetical protein